MKKRKKSKVLIVLIVLFVICSLGAFGYFAYYKFSSKKPVYVPIIKEEFKSKDNTNKIYQSSDVLTKGNRKYLVVKKENNWYEMDSVYSEDNVGFHVLGAYKDILYYLDLDGIKYVDLNLEKPDPTRYALNDRCNLDSVYTSYFDNDMLYVEVDDDPYNTNTDDSEETAYSIISYDLNSNYANKNGKRLTIVKDGPVDFRVIDGKLFYLYDYDDGLYKLKQYSVESDRTSTVLEDICDIDMYKDHLIVTKINPIDEDEKCSMHYFVNPNTGKDIFISNKEFHSVINNVLYFQDNNKLYEFVESTGKINFISNGRMSYSENALYYLNKNKIYKYENGASVLLYTGEEQYKIRGFNVDNSTEKEIIYIYTRAGNYAIVDGKKQDIEDVDKDILKYKVNMKNGKVMTFDYSSDETDDISYDEKLDENEE